MLAMIHGATVPMWEFDRISPLLHARGLQTACLDLYGHGLSDRPRTHYTLALFEQQVQEWLMHIAPSASLYLLGHSLGAAVAAHLIGSARISAEGLLLVAPMVNFLSTQPALRLLQRPLLGRVLVESVVIPLLYQRRRKRYQVLDNGQFIKLFKQQLDKPGFGRALHSLFASGTLGEQGGVYQAVAGRAQPTLVMRGAADSVTTRAQAQQVVRSTGEATYAEIAGAGHACLLTHPHQCAQRVTQFINQHHVTGKQPATRYDADVRARTNSLRSKPRY